MVTRPIVAAGRLPANGVENAGWRAPWPWHSDTSDTALRELGLTRRELDVLALLCLRLTDREIGEHLVIGIRTVHTHVSRILEKLEVANRREAAAVAIRLNGACVAEFEAPDCRYWMPGGVGSRSLS